MSGSNAAILSVSPEGVDALELKARMEGMTLVSLDDEQQRTWSAKRMREHLLSKLVPGVKDPDARLKAWNHELWMHVSLRQIQSLGVLTPAARAFATDELAEKLGFHTSRGIKPSTILLEFVATETQKGTDFGVESKGLMLKYRALKTRVEGADAMVKTVVESRSASMSEPS